MIAIRIRLLLLLMVCSAGPVWAQNTLPLGPYSDAWSARSLGPSVWPEHPNPPAVDVAVDSCVDRLVRADVEELPGVRLNPAALPANDSELLAPLDAKPRATRSSVPSATSWTPKLPSSLLERPPPAAERTTPETVTLPIMPSPADTAATEPTESIDSGSVSALQAKLSHIRLQTRTGARASPISGITEELPPAVPATATRRRGVPIEATGTEGFRTGPSHKSTGEFQPSAIDSLTDC